VEFDPVCNLKILEIRYDAQELQLWLVKPVCFEKDQDEEDEAQLKGTADLQTRKEGRGANEKRTGAVGKWNSRRVAATS